MTHWEQKSTKKYQGPFLGLTKTKREIFKNNLGPSLPLKKGRES